MVAARRIDTFRIARVDILVLRFEAPSYVDWDRAYWPSVQPLCRAIAYVVIGPLGYPLVPRFRELLGAGRAPIETLSESGHEVTSGSDRTGSGGPQVEA